MKDINQWDDFSLSQIGRHHYNYGSLSELKEALDYYGLPQSLANFNLKKLNKANGYIKNDYQSWSSFAYPPIAD